MLDDNVHTINTAGFTETPRLSLEQATGDVYVRGWDKPEIHITTDNGRDYFDVEQTGSQIIVRNRPTKVKFGFERPDAPHIRLDVEGLGEEIGRKVEGIAARVERSVERSMRRHGRHMDFGMELGRWAGGHDFQIKVPHNCDLTLRTSSGDINIENINGVLYAQTASGDMTLRGIQGTSLVQSASGDITIHDLAGKLALSTASGDVHVLGASMQELSARTMSGDLTLDFVSVPQDGLELKTVSGDVDVLMPRDARLTIEVSTFSGDIDCALPYEKERQGRGRDRTLRINGGGAPAAFSSISGDIDIGVSKRVQAPSAAAAAPNVGGAPTINMSQAIPNPAADSGEATEDIMQPEGHVEREQQELEILQAVERGEISAHEAMRRLGELTRG